MSFGFGFSLPALFNGVGARVADLAAAIRALFAAGEQGVWYDPSDLTTLYQDAAGTTPVTAVEQPVGRILDKSGRGNHATQTTSTSRPVLSARVNLLTYTEDFTNSVWAAVGGGVVTANTHLSPVGTLTADTVTDVSTDTATGPATSLTVASPTARYRASIWTRKTTGPVAHYPCIQVAFITGGTTTFAQVYLNTTTGIVTARDNTQAGTTFGVQSDGDYWLWWAEGANNNTGNTLVRAAFFPAGSLDGTTGSVSATGSAVFWGASLVLADQSNLPYQRVNTATDYDTAGFPHYLRFDGVDDFLVTNSINFTATDKMTVFAGVRKLSDAATGVVAELSVSSSSNSSSFNLTAPNSTGYGWRSVGTLLSDANSTGTPAPESAVLTCIGDIAADVSRLMRNGLIVAQSTADQGTGNYGNYPLYIGRRGGTTQPFNGHLYSLVVRGAQTTDQQIIDAEKYVNDKNEGLLT